MQLIKQDEKLGNKGEDLAVSFLKDKGYHIIERNFYSKAGEIDIIAKDRDTYCFVEVKTRRTQSRGSALESVPDYKKRKLSKMALWYLNSKSLSDVKARFDVVAIQVGERGDPNISLVKNAFECINNYM